MPREMVAVSTTRATVVMMELREMGMDRERICRAVCFQWSGAAREARGIWFRRRKVIRTTTR